MNNLEFEEKRLVVVLWVLGLAYLAALAYTLSI